MLTFSRYLLKIADVVNMMYAWRRGEKGECESEEREVPRFAKGVALLAYGIMNPDEVSRGHP